LLIEEAVACPPSRLDHVPRYPRPSPANVVAVDQLDVREPALVQPLDEDPLRRRCGLRRRQPEVAALLDLQRVLVLPRQLLEVPEEPDRGLDLVHLLAALELKAVRARSDGCRQGAQTWSSLDQDHIEAGS